MAHTSLEGIGGEVSEVEFGHNKRRDYVTDVFAVSDACYDILNMTSRDWTTVTLAYSPHMTTTLSLDEIWTYLIK